ncbi:MAG: substrate-binding domain-containing protein, partial [Ruminococcus sp.]
AQMFHDAKQKHDGLILIGKCSQKGLKSLKRYEKNLISINRNSTTYEVDEVLCDGRKIALTAVNYLISCGHQKIGYVGDCHNETRYIGYQEALVHHGIAPDIDDVYDITPNEKNGYQAMAYFSQLETPPSAFYCANDILAIGMLKYLAQSKNWYYHPSVISSDNIVESQYTTPMLTTVSLPKAEMAHLAIQILTDRMNGGHKAVVKTELQSTLVIRQSVHQYVSTENEPEYYI